MSVRRAAGLLMAMPIAFGLVGFGLGAPVVGVASGIALDLFVILPGLLLSRPAKHHWRGDAAPRLPSFHRWPWGPQ